MNPKIVRTIERASPEMIEVLGDLGVATVHEAQQRSGLLRPYMRPIYPDARAAGSAITILCAPGDNLMIHAAVEICRPGDILVVAGLSESTTGQAWGMFGELLATSCVARGIAGLVIDAGVRDIAELTEMKFPVWAKTISAQGTDKNSAGFVNTPIICAGTEVQPGDVVVGDSDGVVIVKRASAEKVVEAGLARRAKEAATRKRLKSGELGLDIYGLRAKLDQLGIEYED